MAEFADRAAAVLRPRAGMRRHALDEHLEARDALAPGDDLAAVARRLRHQHIFCLAPLGLDQRARGRAADLLVGDQKLRDAERRLRAIGANLAKRMIGQIRAALHVVDAGAERAIAVDLERQPLDESHRMHGVEMAQHQNARRVLAPGRPRHQMVAAAVASGDALDRDGQIAITLGDDIGELVDLRRHFGRRLDLDPAADAVEDFCRIEGLAGVDVMRRSIAFRDIRQCHALAASAASIRSFGI